MSPELPDPTAPEPEVPDADWAGLWNMFVHPDVPGWDALDEATQISFKRIWCDQFAPALNHVVLMLEGFDHRQKGRRN